MFKSNFRVGKFFKGKISFRLFIQVIIIIIIAGFLACNKDNIIGLEIQPDDEKINVYFDSSTVFSAYTFSEDSLTTSNQAYCLLGSYVDPVFGKSKAEFVSQVRLSSSHVRFGKNPKPDSLVLYLDYGILVGEILQYYYGDTLSPQNISVYELEKSIYYDSIYFSNHKIDAYYSPENEIGNLTYFQKSSMDSIAIPLSNELAERFLQADTLILDSNEGFLNFFKGLYLSTDYAENDGAIVYYDILSSKTKMTLYYSNDENDSLQYDFSINDKCSRFNLFDHNYSGAEIEEFINDSLVERDRLFIQSMSGTKAYLKIEFDEEFINKAMEGVSINKAEFVVHLAEDPTSVYFGKPSHLFLSAVNAIGQPVFLDDFYIF